MAKRNNKSNRRKLKVNVKLARLFKMSREQLAVRKTTGGGLHKTRKDTSRSVRNRSAIDDQLS